MRDRYPPLPFDAEPSVFDVWARSCSDGQRLHAGVAKARARRRVTSAFSLMASLFDAMLEQEEALRALRRQYEDSIRDPDEIQFGKSHTGDNEPSSRRLAFLSVFVFALAVMLLARLLVVVRPVAYDEARSAPRKDRSWRSSSSFVHDYDFVRA